MKGQKPIIGITAGFSGKVGPKGSYTIGGDYVKSVVLAGGCPAVLPITTDLTMIKAYVDFIDGYLMPGGEDLSPQLYGEEPVRGVTYFNATKDFFEMEMTKACVAAGKPIFGVCRGMQILNVVFGGSLIQDIPSQYKTEISHVGSMEARDALYHSVHFTPGSRLHKIMGEKVLANSFHHQAVKDVAEGFVITGRSPDGIAEGMESEKYKAYAVQFHPENLAQTYEEFVPLFAALVEDCK